LIPIGENLQKRKPTRWKRLYFLSCENIAPIEKSKESISKINGLEGFTWIKNGAIVKKTFKDWKALLISTPQEQGWPFQVRWVKKAT